MKRIVLSLLTVVSITLTCIFTLNNSYALENFSIYDHTYGEVLENFYPEYYNSLDKKTKDLYNSLDAQTVLGYEQNSQELVIEDTIKQAKYPTVILVLTTPNIKRTNSRQIKFGGSYSSTYPCDMQCFAFLIQKSNGHIVASTFKNATNTVQKSISSTHDVNESKYETYYCRALGTYDTVLGIKSTSSNTLAIH